MTKYRQREGEPSRGSQVVKMGDAAFIGQWETYLIEFLELSLCRLFQTKENVKNTRELYYLDVVRRVDLPPNQLIFSRPSAGPVSSSFSFPFTAADALLNYTLVYRPSKNGAK